MLYLNQLQYDTMPYPTDIEHPGSEYSTRGTVSCAGCGLCAVCMVVDWLCKASFSLEDCRTLAFRVRANHAIGTDMELFAPAAAEQFGLHLEMTDDTSRLADCLKQGGVAIINVGGDREGYTGIFSHRGHFVLAVGVDETEFCILDPSWTRQKYAEEPRRSCVREEGIRLYTTDAVLQQEIAARSPGYYLFTK